MTEHERLQYAKLYLESMANGINPLNKQPVAENDLVRNPHIANCLSYVADILGAVLDNGGTEDKEIKSSKERRSYKLPFFITEEQKSQLQIFDTPTYVSDVANELNRVAAENACKKLHAKDINNWLISVGMLEQVDDGQKTPSKKATEQGILNGIQSVLQYDGKGNPFYRTYYSPKAQRFIYDNIKEIVSYCNQ